MRWTITNSDINNATTFVSVRNAAGTKQFTVTDGSRGLRFQGTGAVGISFDPTTHKVTINAEPTVNNYYHSYSYPSYTYNYYGPRLYDVSGQPRVEYMGAAGGLTQWKSGDVGYYGIADGGVTSAKILNNTITADDIATNAVGSDEIAAGAVGSSEIADGAVGWSKIADDSVQLRKLDIWEATVWRRAGYPITGYAYYWMPFYYGRWTGTWGDTTGYTTNYIPNIYDRRYDRWQIKPDREGTTYLLMLTNHSSHTGVDRYVFEYHEGTGYVLGMMKMDEGMPLEGFEPSPDGMFYVFDDSAFGATVFENPVNYIFDIDQKVVREATPEEKAAADEWATNRLTV